MIDFTKYKENLSVEAFVSIVSRDIIKNMDDDTREIFKNGISYFDIHFSYVVLCQDLKQIKMRNFQRKANACFLSGIGVIV